MIKKATLLKENEMLKRKLYVWENIGIGMKSSVKEKEIATKEFLEKNPDYSFYIVCPIIGLSKGTYYNFLNNKVERTQYEINDEILSKEIAIVFKDSGYRYGVDKIRAVLKKKGIATSPRKISQLMKANNMVKVNVMKRPNSKELEYRRKYFRNLLLRQFDQEEPNKVWVSDLLEIKVEGVKFYLCVILDLFARYIVSWRLSSKRSASLVVNTFKDGFESRHEPIGLMFHSDQGSEYISNIFMGTLKMLGVKQSFSYPGSPHDNACMEGFYSILRREEVNVNIKNYKDSRIIKEYLKDYFTFYNTKRIHQSLGYITPQEKEDEWFKNNN